MSNKRFIPLLIPLIGLILNETVLLYPKLFFVSLTLGSLIIFLGIKLLGRNNKEKFWPFFSILPILLFLSFSTYAALISSGLLVQLFFLAAFVLNFYYLRTLYYYLINKEYDRGIQLSSFSVFAGFFIIFCIYSSVFFLPLFINLQPSLLALIPFPIIWFLFFNGVYFNLKSFTEGALIFFINALVLAQLAWILSYFPLSANILGFIVALIYYLFVIISLLHFKGNLNRKTAKWPIILVLFSFLILFLTAHWL